MSIRIKIFYEITLPNTKFYTKTGFSATHKWIETNYEIVE